MSGWCWSRVFLKLGEAGAQFRCRLFRLDRAPMFGAYVDSWGLCCGLWVSCLEVLVRCIPCRIGTNHSRLRASGWEQYGHGLTSRPQEAAGIGFLDDLFWFFSGILLILALPWSLVLFCC